MAVVNIKRTFGLWMVTAALGALACGEEATLPGASRERDEDAGRKPANEDAGAKSSAEEPSSNGEQTTSAEVTTSEDDTTTSDVDFLVPDGEGDVEVTQVYNGRTHAVGDAEATLRARSDEIEVYVDESFWGTQVTGPQLNAFMHRLVDKGVAGSYRPDLGILATNEAVFGALKRENLPDGKQRIFIVDTAGAGDGYLCGWCEYPDLHLDGTLVTPLDGEIAASISAHELFHGIHRGYDADEEAWLDEALAEAAMSVNGLFTDEAWFDNYLGNPNISWGAQGGDITNVHYGACLVWGSYLWEQGGPELMRALTASPLNGWESVAAALQEVGEARSSWELFLEMGAALYYDAPERGLGFDSFDLLRPVTASALIAGTPQSIWVEPYGLVHLRLDSGGTLTVEADETYVPIAFVEEKSELSIQMLNANEPIELPAGVVVMSAQTLVRVRVSLD